MQEKEYIAFQSIIEESANKLWGAHFVVPEGMAQIFLSQGSQRVFCKINGQVEYQCALLPFGNGKRVITVNKTLRTKLNLNFGSTVNVELCADDSEYGLPMPEEFAELLKMDKEANDFFHALTAGKQRTLLYVINKPKQSDKKIAFALAIAEHLKMNKGKIDFKQLNIQLKSC